MKMIKATDCFIKEVRINNRRGKVISVSPGRVLVDYNHQWAGKDVFFEFMSSLIISEDISLNPRSSFLMDT